MNAKFQWNRKHVLWTLKKNIPVMLITAATSMVVALMQEHEKGIVSERAYNLGYDDAIEAQKKESEETEVTEA